MAEMHLPVCAWRIEHQELSRPGFTTELELAKEWVGRGATVVPLHVPSEEGAAKATQVAARVIGMYEAMQRAFLETPIPKVVADRSSSSSITSLGMFTKVELLEISPVPTAGSVPAPKRSAKLPRRPALGSGKAAASLGMPTSARRGKK